MIRYSNCRLIYLHGVREDDLWVKNGKIVSPGDPSEFDEVTMGGALVAPGFIDIQMNGGYGVDFCKRPEGVEDVARRLPATGVTSFLPTLVTLPDKNYKSLIPHFTERSVARGATILGVHIEGPWIHPNKKGAHPEDAISEIPKEKRNFTDSRCVRLVTLAPELDRAEDFISHLVSKNVVVSMGHSTANYNQADRAVQAGAKMVTHLFNAMTALHHRKPGLAGFALEHPYVYCGLIVDGIHVHPSFVKIAWKCKPEHIILVTDAMSAMGLKDGSYTIGEMEVDVLGQRAVLRGTETLAGSVISMDEALRFFRKFTGADLASCIRAASYNPARILGIDDKKGSLDPGRDADFVVLSDDLQVKRTYIAGERVY